LGGDLHVNAARGQAVRFAHAPDVEPYLELYVR
jgi:hypothetical protein